ncbi:MAG: serine/threonine-protein kinase [Verrucomicrobiota bacterium]
MHATRPDSPLTRPWARGLDLGALAALGLEGGAGGPPPELCGYQIQSLLGTGSLGHVWKAIRLADTAQVALKIPHAADSSFSVRLQNEAESLQRLNHPHIVRCLNHGTSTDGHPWLELEYVDGAPLSALIPHGGFSWVDALHFFRAISAAVIHAHENGVLHRDLKPSNILIGHDGSIKVADFGLARPMEERVVSFSLTLSGNVAGTAEYLAPECYIRNCPPSPAADLYALGVILYELLAGHPPRGAWLPVSQQKTVDIRVDDVLRRALDPDPAKRFPTVQAMMEEVEGISRTPPRYAGTPRFTPGVQFMDAAWTVLGLFIFLGALGLVVRIGKYGISLPVDLIGKETMRIGAYQGIQLLLLLAVPLGLWQILRLRRFRRVPLREALPSPFGLRLGTSRVAALSVLLSQFFLLLAPGVLGAYAWRETCAYWLKEGDPPWTQGLVVTAGYRGMVAHDPWQWPVEGKDYSLRERSGWITDPLSKDIDHTSFMPGLGPRIFAGSALFYGATLIITFLSALATWWRFRKWGRTSILMVLTGLSANMVKAETKRHQEDGRRQSAAWDHDAWSVESHAVKAVGVRGWLFPADAPPNWENLPQEQLSQYARTVDFGAGETRSGPAVAEYLAAHAAHSRAVHRVSTGIKLNIMPEGPPPQKRFLALSYYEDFSDPPDAPATGSLTILALRGNILPRVGAEITSQSVSSATLWSADPRPLGVAESTSWAKAFLAALHAPPATGQPDPLKALFLPRLLRFAGAGPEATAAPWETVIHPLRDICARGSRPTLARSPGPASALPGARRRLLMEIEDHGNQSTWTADLIFNDGRWQCVRLEF